MTWSGPAAIINAAAIQMGVYSTAVANPFASTDQQVTQLVALLQEVGRGLTRDYSWGHLRKEHAFSTVAATGDYALPADFARIQDQTAWNRSTQYPLVGPASAQTWNTLKSITSANTWEYAFRIQYNKVRLEPIPTSAASVAFEYLSSWWVLEAADTQPTGETVSVTTQTLAFDPRLLTMGLKLAYRSAKGFDTMAVQRDYDNALAAALGGSEAGAIGHLDTQGDRRLPLPPVRAPLDTWGQ